MPAARPRRSPAMPLPQSARLRLPGQPEPAPRATAGPAGRGPQALAARTPTRTPRRWKSNAAANCRWTTCSVSRCASWPRPASGWRSASCLTAPILVADTTVALGRRILGKPQQPDEAARHPARAVGPQPPGADGGGGERGRAALHGGQRVARALRRPCPISASGATWPAANPRQGRLVRHPGPHRGLDRSAWTAATAA
jgi:hypothetical protein